MLLNTCRPGCKTTSQHEQVRYFSVTILSLLISQRQTTLQSTEGDIVGDGGEATTTFVSKNCSTSGWCVHVYYSPPSLPPPHLPLLPFLPPCLPLPSLLSLSFIPVPPSSLLSVPASLPFSPPPPQTTSNADTLFADMKERRQKRRGQVNNKHA